VLNFLNKEDCNFTIRELHWT